ncbi:MAG: signal peptide peptidase SppA [Candidatus Dadabacteria bacterium]|nr:signal peptide peptidase SppA [Candidatus Dadabacteria bacterium]
MTLKNSLRLAAAGVIVIVAIAFVVGARAPKVAVLKIEGVILSAETYTRAAREIERDDSIKALVVRIDSPGGSVAASQEIHALVRRLGEKMPTVASMGNIATSGGYYVACGAPVIVANPGTVTGSIGVIATFANYGDLLRWAKMDFEVIKTGEFKDSGSPLRPLSEEEREYLQGIMDGALGQFQKAVADSRGMSAGQVEKVSDGKIILGLAAQEAGLVDEMGTLQSAIEMAAEKAGIPADSPVENFPEQPLGLSSFISQLSGAADVGAVAERILRPSGLYYLSARLAAGKVF